MINKLPLQRGILTEEQRTLLLNTILEAYIFINPLLNPHFGESEPAANLRRDGFPAYADGVNWNPGSGEGYYRYDTATASWLPMSSASPVVSKTSSYTATAADSVILCNATSGNVTITLPTSVGTKGRQYTIKKTDASANLVIIDGAGAETIDGELTIELAVQYESMTIHSDNAGWVIV
jgi:hypothetical protein